MKSYNETKMAIYIKELKLTFSLKKHFYLIFSVSNILLPKSIEVDVRVSTQNY